MIGLGWVSFRLVLAVFVCFVWFGVVLWLLFGFGFDVVVIFSWLFLRVFSIGFCSCAFFFYRRRFVFFVLVFGVFFFLFLGGLGFFFCF